eukprot:g2459.t1
MDTTNTNGDTGGVSSPTAAPRPALPRAVLYQRERRRLRSRFRSPALVAVYTGAAFAVIGLMAVAVNRWGARGSARAAASSAARTTAAATPDMAPRLLASSSFSSSPLRAPSSWWPVSSSSSSSSAGGGRGVGVGGVGGFGFDRRSLNTADNNNQSGNEANASSTCVESGVAVAPEEPPTPCQVYNTTNGTTFSLSFTESTTSTMTNATTSLVENINGDKPASDPLNATYPYRTVFADLDAFSLQEKRDGAMALHLISCFFVFSGLAIVGEYLDPALAALSDAVGLTPDVAASTFMALGGSSPELATSILGTFVAKNDIGIGTIVGSAVFNVLLVPAVCAFVSKDLVLSWYPLGRDSIFYNFAIIVLTFVIFDGVVAWFESVVMMFVYVMYVTLMKHNAKLSKWTEKQLANTGKPRGVFADGLKLFVDSKSFTALVYLMIIGNVALIIYDYVLGECGGALNLQGCAGPDGMTYCKTGSGKNDECCSIKDLLETLSHVCNVFFILEMILKHIGGGIFAYWRDALNAFDGVLVLISVIEYILGWVLAGSGATGVSSLKSLRMFRFFRALRALRILRFAKMLSKKEAKAKRMSLSMEAHSMPAKTTRGGVRMQVRKTSALPIRKRRLSSIIPTPDGAAALAQLQAEMEGQKEAEAAENDAEELMPEEDDEPVNPFERPKDGCSCLWWFITRPLGIAIWVTVPDCRRPRFAKFYLLTFIMCFVWIAGLTFLMVWSASEVGSATNIPPQVIGLTLLAIGTSVPDLLSSIALSRQGFGDMAISNSIGSNIFDVCIGLPLPWFMYSAVAAPLRKFCVMDVTSSSKALNIQILLIFVCVSGLMLGVLFF